MAVFVHVLHVPDAHVHGLAYVPHAVGELVGVDAGCLLVGQIGGYGCPAVELERPETQVVDPQSRHRHLQSQSGHALVHFPARVPADGDPVQDDSARHAIDRIAHAIIVQRKEACEWRRHGYAGMPVRQRHLERDGRGGDGVLLRLVRRAAEALGGHGVLPDDVQLLRHRDVEVRRLRPHDGLRRRLGRGHEVPEEGRPLLD